MKKRSLKQKVVKGGFWVFLARIISRGFSFVRLIILARLLAPEDFGLMGIALLSMATLETFSETGFSQALIQKKERIETYLNVAWTISVIRGMILFGVLYLVAPYAAAFFEAPLAKPIIQVIGFSFLFRAFVNIGVVYFQKNLEFHKQFFYELSGILADFFVAVTAVLIIKSVWALVFGLLAGGITKLIISYFIHPWRPKIDLNFTKARELFSFGKWIFGSTILIFLLTQGDDIFVGKLLGVAALGFYQLAYKISNMPATEISHIISQVTFPVYSKLQDNLPKLREVYLKVLQATAFLSFPVAGLIFTLAPDFTELFLGEKWLPMVPAMMMLSVFGVTRMINATTGSVFQGMGKPGINTLGSAFQLMILVVIIYPLTRRLGILGTSLAVVIPNIFFMLYINRKLGQVFSCRLISLAKPLIPAFIGSLAMCLTIFFFKFRIWGAISLNSFFFFALLGIVAYLTTILILNKSFDFEFKSNLKEMFKTIVR